ncbi:2513_t:CDS:2 [Dentiscutata erythropus]|uniref:2513_t:CDS:1 n=1 Tax=Dentiscutata erythropus TaxID=1348616 RepID=A0A9N9NCH3_9GLOM|nr:2513_t:CDS:2 [Dentiscutata erythropus]
MKLILAFPPIQTRDQDSADKSYPVFDAQKIELDLTCDDQETTDESDSMFDDQETINESDLIVENRENTNESDLILNNQDTSNETDSIFDDHETENESSSIFDDEFVSMFDEQEIVDKCDPIFNDCEIADVFSEENADDLNKIFEEDVLEDSEETEDKLWSNDGEHDNIDFPNVIYRDFIDIGSITFLILLEIRYLILKKILPRSTKEGLHFLDTLKKNHVKFSSTSVAQGHQERVYSEFYNCNWWGHVQQHIPFGHKVLAIILYLDTTTLDRLGKNSRHPVFISLGNIPTNLRNKAKSKALVGIIPTLQGTKEKQQTPQFRQLIRSTFYKCIKIFIKPLHLQYQSEVLLKINSYNLRYNMVIATGQGKYYSLYEEINSFWSHLCFNIYIAMVPERMHHLDLGLFPYMVKFTRDLLKFHGGITLVNKMDLRLGLIPRYPGLKVFNSGLADLALFTASEYKHMMKIMPFVLEGLIEENESLVNMFINWNKMYQQSRQYKFTQTKLFQFENLLIFSVRSLRTAAGF